MEVRVKRRYFTKIQKISILNELSLSGVSLSELARKYQISPVVLYKWRKKMDINQESDCSDALTVMKLFKKWKGYDNNVAPHSGWGMKSPLEYRKLMNQAV